MVVVVVGGTVSGTTVVVGAGAGAVVTGLTVTSVRFLASSVFAHPARAVIAAMAITVLLSLRRIDFSFSRGQG
jgi:ABC-type transport system involved in multi-copper enzyme maturation permease subunit